MRGRGSVNRLVGPQPLRGGHRRWASDALPEAATLEDEVVMDVYCEYELWQYGVSWQDWLEYWCADHDLAGSGTGAPVAGDT